jgi:hypothetical protein
MARRIGHGDEAAGQLCLWSEESLPSPFHGEGQDGGAAAVHHGSTPTPTLPLTGGGRDAQAPSPSQGEGGDGGASRSKSRPLRAVAAARKDTIARSERALAAIRSILASDSREEAARHAAAFRRNR